MTAGAVSGQRARSVGWARRDHEVAAERVRAARAVAKKEVGWMVRFA